MVARTTCAARVRPSRSASVNSRAFGLLSGFRPASISAASRDISQALMGHLLDTMPPAARKVTMNASLLASAAVLLPPCVSGGGGKRLKVAQSEGLASGNREAEEKDG